MLNRLQDVFRSFQQERCAWHTLQVGEILVDKRTIARVGPAAKVKLRDKDDLRILGVAVVAGAEVFVTGDKGRLKLGRVENLEILSPRQFWEKLKAQQKGQPKRGKARR